MTWRGRAALLALIVWANVGMQLEISPIVGVGVTALLLVLAWRLVPGLLRHVVGFGVGGAVAGLLILGPGLRLAMRAVAIVDPVEVPEFTIEGTGFIILGIGLMFGAIQAVTGGLFRLLLGIKSAVVAGVLVGTVFIVGLVFFSGEISEEIFSLGAGAWMNIPLFGTIALAYGIAAMALADKFGTEMFKTRRTEREKVPA